MIVTYTNVISGLIPTVTTGASTDLPQNITDPDFSSLYKSSASDLLVAEFGAVGPCNYVATAGTNIKGIGDGQSYVRVYDGSEVVATINVSTDQVVVVSFGQRVFTNLKIVLKNLSGGANPIIRYAAAGMALTIPNGGETAGYNRQFLNRNTSNKTIVNGLAAPVAQLRKQKQAQGTLTLPNMTRAFSENQWQEFLTFADDSLFFIKEQEDVVVNASSGTNPSAYLCYDISNSKVSAHPQTRSLNNLSVSFKVFTGL